MSKANDGVRWKVWLEENEARAGRYGTGRIEALVERAGPRLQDGEGRNMQPRIVAVHCRQCLRGRMHPSMLNGILLC